MLLAFKKHSRLIIRLEDTTFSHLFYIANYKMMLLGFGVTDEHKVVHECEVERKRGCIHTSPVWFALKMEFMIFF